MTGVLHAARAGIITRPDVVPHTCAPHAGSGFSDFLAQGGVLPFKRLFM